MIPTEREEQICLVKWLQINKIFFFAPTNENNAHMQNRHYAMIAEQKAKATGKIKGVSDLIVMLKDKLLFIELKKRRKLLKSGKYSTAHTKVSKEQIAFLDKVKEYPYAAGKVCYGYKEAIEFIKEHKG